MGGALVIEIFMLFWTASVPLVQAHERAGPFGNLRAGARGPEELELDDSELGEVDRAVAVKRAAAVGHRVF